MNYSPINLNQLEECQFDVESVLKEVFEEVIESRVPSSEEEFKSVLEKASELLYTANPRKPCLQRSIYNFKERGDYIEHIKEEIGKLASIPQTRLEVGKIGWTVYIMGIAKAILDLYDGYSTLYKIKKNNGDYRIIRQLQNEKMDGNSSAKIFIKTYEEQKMKELVNLGEQYEKPIVNVSGFFQQDPYHQAELVGSFGELFQPTLLLVNADEKALEEIKSRINSLQIREDVKSMILRKIKPVESVDEVINGHYLNFDMFVKNMERIIKVMKPFFDKYDRKESSIPLLEWEGHFTVLYPENLVGPKTFYNPEAINRKLDYVNSFRVPLGYEPIPHVGIDVLPEKTNKDVYVS